MSCDCAELKTEILSQRQIMAGWYENLMSELRDIKFELQTKATTFNIGEEESTLAQPLISKVSSAVKPFSAIEVIGNSNNTSLCIEAASNTKQVSKSAEPFGNVGTSASDLVIQELFPPKIEPSIEGFSTELNIAEMNFSGLTKTEKVASFTAGSASLNITHNISEEQQQSKGNFYRATKTNQSSHIGKHLMTHSKKKPYSCDQCNSKWSCMSQLLTHKRNHTGERPFSCEICSFRSSRKSTLIRHARCHTGEKPYSCSYCDYRSNQKSHLLEHLRTHTGEKPFKCDFCNFRAAVKSTIHSHIHNKHKDCAVEKPFSCELCSYRCSNKSALMRHSRSHSGEKPYFCSYCDYRSNQKGHLIEHQRKHTGEKPFICNFCNYRSAFKSSLNAHIQSRHKDCVDEKSS